ncbi:hypothetical protein D9615_005039 [Tricholomella constricta]|uniref:Transmembrane protein n=1 Tax=Tricholomella constricta TaxID=117010 RepID=A0A8H5HHB0_9AGAR|nr:hypothetical protein D9615_005039 [Tricholomella constricta]
MADRVLGTIFTTARNSCLSLLLFLPLRYLSQAIPILLAICLHPEPDSSQILDAMDPSSATARAAQTTGLPIRCNRNSSELGRTTSSIARPEPVYNNMGPSSSAIFESPTTPRFPSIDFVHGVSNPTDRIHTRWSAYVDARCREWVIVATSAGTLAAVSPSILQMLGANDDPLTRSLAFLSVSRAISAIAYAVILLLYFQHGQAKSGLFAMRWFNNVQVHENSVVCMPWTILAIPAIALCWGVILLILALFCSIWQAGYVASPSAPPTDAHSTIDVLMRVIITVWFALDVASILWIFKTLKELTPGVYQPDDPNFHEFN